MSRLIRHDATGPRKLDLEDFENEKGNVAICQCGLSEEYPFCDGSHRTTRSEDDELYRYRDDSADGERRIVVDIEYREE